MKITICSSIDFKDKIIEVVEKLRAMGHEVFVPGTIERIMRGEVDFTDHVQSKGTLAQSKYIAENDLIRKHWRKIQESDAILIVNELKKGITGYIGANTFLELGFAHVLEKKIFVLNPLPETGAYLDEIRAINPLILNGDLTLVQL